MGRWPDLVPLHSLDDYVVRIAETGGALRDGVQHRLQVGRGGADDAEDLAGGGRLLEGLAEVDVEAGVLDGNGGLIGKRLEEGDLLGQERADLRPANDDEADGLAPDEQGCREERSDTGRLGSCLGLWKLGSNHVPHLDRPPLAHRGPAVRAMAARGCFTQRPGSPDLAVLGHEPKLVTLDLEGQAA